MGVAVISVLSGSFWCKNQLFRPLHCILIWHEIVVGIDCQIVPLFVHKMGRKFPRTLTTKCVNISASAQPFFTKQGTFYSQLDNKLYDHTIIELSDDIKNSPEWLSLRLAHLLLIPIILGHEIYTCNYTIAINDFDLVSLEAKHNS